MMKTTRTRQFDFLRVSIDTVKEFRGERGGSRQARRHDDPARRSRVIPFPQARIQRRENGRSSAPGQCAVHEMRAR